jgi:crotonobetainyl-CoA:carnitine CoA-transferase CaiB-like acyl-CoA transferase
LTAIGGLLITAATPEEQPRRWLRTAAAILVGVAAIVGVFVALMEVQGWGF